MKRGTIVFFIFAVSVLVLVIGVSQLFPRPGPPQNGDEDVWIYPESDDANPLWGVKNGIVFGTEKAEMNFKPGGAWAKGLLRIGWTDEEGKSHFFNYIGVTIIQLGSRVDSSEIQRIIFNPDNKDYANALQDLLNQYPDNSSEVQDFISLEKNPPASLSQVTTFEDDEMTVLFRLSTFQYTEAKIYLIIVVNRNNPREIKISTYNQEEEANPLNFIVISATWGNLARLRDLYLGNRTVNARELFEGEELGDCCFYPRVGFGVGELIVDEEDTVTVYAGNDEEGEWIADLGNGAPYYDGEKIYQYWRKYADSYSEELHVAVNGREKYFGGFVNPCGNKDITGGVSYENFEMIEEYYPRQTFWFGYDYTVED